MTDYVKKYDICQVLNRLEIRLGDKFMNSWCCRFEDALPSSDSDMKIILKFRKATAERKNYTVGKHLIGKRDEIFKQLQAGWNLNEMCRSQGCTTQTMRNYIYSDLGLSEIYREAKAYQLSSAKRKRIKQMYFDYHLSAKNISVLLRVPIRVVMLCVRRRKNYERNLS
jgi:hypothetical protein